MSKRWSLILFSAVFTLLFVLFQFDSDTRKALRASEKRRQQLELQMQSMSRALANQSTTENILELRRMQDFIIEEFRTHRQKVTDLLELLVSKDERFERELNEYKKEFGFRAPQEAATPGP